MNDLSLSKEEQVHDEVIEVSRRLFKQYGLTKTTMEDIAREIGRGKSTLYYYFKSKDDIFDAVVHREMKEALDVIEAATQQHTLATEKINAFFSTTTQTLKSKANLYKIVKGELREFPALITKLKNLLDEKELALVKSIILYGVETGEFKPSIAKEADLLAFLMVSTLRSLSLDLLTSEMRAPNLEETIHLLTDILLNGMNNEPYKK